MKRFTTFLLIAFLSVPVITFAQYPATTPLETGDLDKFIKTYKPLTADLDALGEDFDEIEDYNAIQALAANEQVKAVLRKHGWDENWMGKWVTISVSYSFIKMEEEMANLPADQRAYVEQYMSSSMTPLKEMVTESDVKKVRERLKELDELFSN